MPTDNEKLLAYYGWLNASDSAAFIRTVSNIWFCSYDEVCDILTETEIEVEGK